MPSAIWTGTISFGLVTVPVRAVTATRSRDVRFNQLEESTGARIRYRKVSEQSGDEVSSDQIVKGYEIAPGQYVTLSDDEMQALAPKSSRTIDIEDFVDLDEIDPVYFQQPYYLAPDPNAVKPYRLLLDAMQELRKVAIGRFVMRSKEHLVAIRPLDGLLCLETMRYPDEIVPVHEVVPPLDEAEEPSTRELSMARQLVESLTSEFEPDKYHDTYREELLALIEQKAAGEEVVARPAVEETGKVLDLMAALEASLARAGKGAPAAEAADQTDDADQVDQLDEAGEKGSGTSRAKSGAKPSAKKSPAKKSPAKATAKRTGKPAKKAPAKSTGRTKRSA